MPCQKAPLHSPALNAATGWQYFSRLGHADINHEDRVHLKHKEDVSYFSHTVCLAKIRYSKINFTVPAGKFILAVAVSG